MGYYDTTTKPAWANTDPVMADVSPYESLPAPTRRRNKDTDDQIDLKDWYRNCGPVRIVTNTPAATLSQQKLVIEYDNGRNWEQAADPRFAEIMRHFRTRHGSQQDLIRTIAVNLRVPAEGYLVFHKEGDTPYYSTVQTSALTAVQNRPGFSEYFTRQKARRGEPGHHMVPDRHVYWYHHPDPDWPDDAWSPLLAGADSILRYRKAYRHVGRTLDSKMAMSNILWMQATSQQTDFPKQVYDWAFNGVEQDDGIESFAPLVAVTEHEPKTVETGTEVYQEQVAIALDAKQQFASDVDFPTSWMIEGPGQAKYDNESATFIWYLDNSVKSLGTEVTDVLTRVHLRPFLSATPLGTGLEPLRFRVRADDADMRPTGDREHDIVRMYELGLITREALAQLCGIDVAHMMTLPEGIVDYEHWLASRAPASIATSPYGVSGIHRTDPADILDAEIIPEEFAAISADIRQHALAPAAWDRLV